jgi:hypothetical protein
VLLTLRMIIMKLFLIGLIAFSLSGCMSGTMRGAMSDNQAVSFNYEQGFSSDTYTAVIDGEHFEGKAVMVDATTTFGTAFGSAYSQYGSAFGSANSIAFSSSGKVKAVMIGSRGSTLRCLMNYADSSGITSSGGVGECIHSDGRRIDIVW